MRTQQQGPGSQASGNARLDRYQASGRQRRAGRAPVAGGGDAVRCVCGGQLVGHGTRSRYIVDITDVLSITVPRLLCTSCGKTVYRRPSYVFRSYQCSRPLAKRIRELWAGGRCAMSDVRSILLTGNPRLPLYLSSMYRWARIPL